MASHLSEATTPQPADGLVLVQQLAEHLQDEAVHVAAFRNMLEREAGLLAGPHRPEDMQAVVEEKVLWVDQLERDEEARRLLLDRMGAPGHGPQVLDALAARHAILQRPWTVLREQTRVAAEISQRNVAMLAVHLEHVHGALAQMRKTHDKHALYDARGRTRRWGGASRTP